jgi:hypothetical protein
MSFNAMPAMIIYTMFPSVAFKKPITLWLVLMVTCSVPNPSNAVSGTMYTPSRVQGEHENQGGTLMGKVKSPGGRNEEEANVQWGVP